MIHFEKLCTCTIWYTYFTHQVLYTFCVKLLFTTSTFVSRCKKSVEFFFAKGTSVVFGNSGNFSKIVSGYWYNVDVTIFEIIWFNCWTGIWIEKTVLLQQLKYTKNLYMRTLIFTVIELWWKYCQISKWRKDIIFQIIVILYFYFDIGIKRFINIVSKMKLNSMGISEIEKLTNPIKWPKSYTI